MLGILNECAIVATTNFKFIINIVKAVAMVAVVVDISVVARNCNSSSISVP